ncbi:MAG: helix-turn-helix transcriptional regulator [Mycobacterium sp.]|jgi:transcriptional regulator with XRE-family HTH domain|nr:helix-turn-helix transcriptional regulator [Mycobacterium sp.]MBV8291833.1 helix-turn-helix transcriptional regulator [Mycobacterium sp.]
MPETWWEYVQRISRGAPHKDIAAAAGVDPSRITGWKNGDRPNAQNAVGFARAYDRNPVEALIASGYLDQSEVSGVVELSASPARLSADDLLGEIRRRIR